LLHTSDWHLGRALHQEPLLADQSHALDQILALAREDRVDAIVIAGDVYDRAVPPSDAVTLLDDFVARVQGDLRIPLILIAGNHDSPERLGFGARVLEMGGVHIWGDLRRVTEPVVVEGRQGDVAWVYPLPYIEPELVRGASGEDRLRDHAAATECVAASARRHRDSSRGDFAAVAVAHAFVNGAEESKDSERPLAVGGSGAVPEQVFSGFDYVALGHLHAPQALAGGKLRYSGSLLKYAFSEAEHVKGALVVDVGPGQAEARFVPIAPKRDVVRVKGTLDELLRRADLEAHRGDLIEACLTDPGYVVDPMSKLRRRFPYAVHVTREAWQLAEGAGGFSSRINAAGGDDERLFAGFFEAVTGAAPGPEHRALFASALTETRGQERAA
jgi:exonuclease SbcD